MIVFFLSWHGRLAAHVLFHFKAASVESIRIPFRPSRLLAVVDEQQHQDTRNDHDQDQCNDPDDGRHGSPHIMSASSSVPPSPFFFSSWMFRPKPRISLQS